MKLWKHNVDIAALATDAGISHLLDEPTSALDIESARRIEEMLLRLRDFSNRKVIKGIMWALVVS